MKEDKHIDSTHDFLDKALAHLENEGYAESSIEDLAAAAGVPLETALKAFPSRDHVAAAIMERVVDTLPAQFKDEIDETSSLRDRLWVGVAHEMRMMAPYRRFVADLFHEGITPFSQTTALQLPVVARYLTFVTEQIRIARSRGEIHAWVPPAIAAGGFWLVHLRIVAHWLNDESPNAERTHALADTWITRFVVSLGAPAPSHPPRPATG